MYTLSTNCKIIAKGITHTCGMIKIKRDRGHCHEEEVYEESSSLTAILTGDFSVHKDNLKAMHSVKVVF